MKTETTESQLIKRHTAQSFDTVCQRVEDACSKHSFGVLGKVDLRQKMQSKGVDFEPQCTVFEVCNPQKASEVLSVNMDISSSLPCRIAIYTEGKQTVVSTLRPTLMLALYETPGAETQAQEVEDTMSAIIQELASEQSGKRRFPA